MGHYLGEMEDDGVPRNWKAGSSAASGSDNRDRNWRRELFQEIAHTRILQERIGRYPTKKEIRALGASLEARRHRIAAIRLQASRSIAAIEEEALTEVLEQSR